MAPDVLMRKIVTAFAKSDLQPLLNAIDDNTVWKSPSPRGDLFRFSGTHAKRAGIVDVTSKIAMTYSMQRFEPREIVTNGDIVWCLLDVEADYRPLGKEAAIPKPIKLEIAVRWLVRDDKIVEHQSFFDTASLLHQQGEFPANN